MDVWKFYIIMLVAMILFFIFMFTWILSESRYKEPRKWSKEIERDEKRQKMSRK